MPVYEFACESCQRRVEVFTRSVSASVTAVCDRCGSTHLRRAVSRFAFHQSASNTYGNMGKFLDVDVDENDPEAMAHWARGMKEHLGEDAGPELDELIAEGAQAGGLAEAPGETASGAGGHDLSE